MQLYALDEAGQIIFAKDAIRHTNYYCLECRGAVRVRGGMHRHTHYYHLALSQSCRLNGKSMAHLQTQMRFQTLLGRDCALESRFSEIGRIADVVWWPQKMIFEIQCSAISPVEIEARNKDYASLGFEVIWILHDQEYNQWRESAAESYLKYFPHYFTNIDGTGQGKIYDQYRYYIGGIRKAILEPLEINIHAPYVFQNMDFGSSAFLLQRQKWKRGFAGDLLQASEQLEKIVQIENSRKKAEKGTFLKTVGNFYLRIFRLILEKACQ